MANELLEQELQAMFDAIRQAVTEGKSVSFNIENHSHPFNHGEVVGKTIYIQIDKCPRVRFD